MPRKVLLLLALASFCISSLVLFTAYELIYRDRVILGVNVQGQSMSGLTREQAKQFLQSKLGSPDAILARFGGEGIVLRDGDRSWRAYPWELGLRTDLAPIADAAILLGHRSNWATSLIEQARCIWFGCDLSIDAQFDIYTAQAYLRWLAPQVARPPRDASVQIDGLRVLKTAPQNGREVDGDAMIDLMRNRVLVNGQGDLNITFRETPPLITEAGAAQSQIQAILAAPAMLAFGGRTWAIDQGALASMIRIRPKQDSNGKLGLTAALDHAQLVAYLKPLAAEINQPARNARLRFDPNTGAVTPLVTSQYGQTLDPEAAALYVEQQLMASVARTPGLATPLDSIAARTIGLPVTVTKPAVALEDVAKFGIKELVAQGVSNFKGSAPGRIQNIRTATAQFDGVVVPPGGTFSFDQLLNDVVEANGYDDAYVIFADRTVLGPGGGVCQVSTTVFRAAFFGGFPIVERWAHAYRVGYYEPPIGLDATVFAPSVDFKFKNDTDAYLLIQPKLDLKTTTLTFNFYGTKPNRTVQMEDPIIENVIPHGPAVYTEDPTLKKGVTKQIDFAHDGADATVWRKILVNGQVVKRDKFFSRYEPWVARYLVGTKVVK